MPNKLVFEIHNCEPITSEFVRVNQKCKDYINQIRRDTGLSATKILEKVLEYAVDNYEIKEI